MSKLYTKAELTELKEVLPTIATFIPENRAAWVWDNYKKIANTNENRPCMCGSSANLWKKAFTTIDNYLKTNPEPIDESGSEQ